MALQGIFAGSTEKDTFVVASLCSALECCLLLIIVALLLNRGDAHVNKSQPYIATDSCDQENLYPSVGIYSASACFMLSIPGRIPQPYLT